MAWLAWLVLNAAGDAEASTRGRALAEARYACTLELGTQCRSHGRTRAGEAWYPTEACHVAKDWSRCEVTCRAACE